MVQKAFVKKEEVLNVIERLRTQERMTMVLVTHEINFVKEDSL